MKNSNVVESVRGWTNEALRTAYKQYVVAMERNRPGCALEKDRFMMYIREAKVFRLNGSYIFGQLGGGIFKISHFAPKSLKGGLAALQALLASEQPTVLAVTGDMGVMLERMGHECCVEMTMDFRGEEVKKMLFSNSKTLRAEFRAKKKMIDAGRASAQDFSWLMNCASLEWATARYGWAEYTNNA